MPIPNLEVLDCGLDLFFYFFFFFTLSLSLPDNFLKSLSYLYSKPSWFTRILSVHHLKQFEVTFPSKFGTMSSDDWDWNQELQTSRVIFFLIKVGISWTSLYSFCQQWLWGCAFLVGRCLCLPPLDSGHSTESSSSMISL